MRNPTKVVRPRLSVLTVVAVLGISACAPQYQNHGYIPPQEDLDQITIGTDTRDTVTETMGVPASAGLLNDSGYYYVRSRRRAIGFLPSKEVEREVVAVSFTANGIVQNVERFGLERGNVITLDRRVTSAPTTDRSFIRQLLGNIGRFNPAAAAG